MEVDGEIQEPLSPLHLLGLKFLQISKVSSWDG